MKNLAIIPARSGSKGVPGKNLKPLGGAPLLWWTLEAAMLAGEADFNLSNFPATVDDKQVSFKPVFDTVLVTSESEEILESTRKWEAGHNVQGLARLCVQLRHDKLAMDHVQTDEVLLDALRHLEYLGEGDFDNICLLQPTSPFRTYQHIYESWLFYENLRTNPVKEINCLISGTEVVSHLDGYHWFGNDEMSMVVEPMGHNPTFRMGRQWENPLPTKLYKENGAIYWFDAKQFSLRRFYRMSPFGIYPMDNESSLDINTVDDWNQADERVARWYTGVK
jgi:CMP-N,N'-diacetyllegionaminic acid synthase